ncbi:hypothetical protein M5D96_005242, partial [Drosophila gunungcola]
PVRNGISSGFGFMWYSINVCSGRCRKKRFFINLTRFPSLLPKVLSNTLEFIHQPKWSTIFLLTSPRAFMSYKARFPMTSIVTVNFVKILSDMKQSICEDFLFIADSGYWRYSNLHNPYAQNASFAILNTSISAENTEGLFNKYRKTAENKNLNYLRQF